MTYRSYGERNLSRGMKRDSTGIMVEAEDIRDVVRVRRPHEALHQVNHRQLGHGYDHSSASNLGVVSSPMGYRSGWLSGVLMALLVITVVPLVPMLCAFIAGIFINRSISNKE